VEFHTANCVKPGGQDSEIMHPDLTAELRTSYLLQTHDVPPAHIVVRMRGFRVGPREVLRALGEGRGGAVDPREYKFRLFVEMETGDERYRGKVNFGMWVGSAMRRAGEVVYE